jgi:hypothetical protein
MTALTTTTETLSAASSIVSAPLSVRPTQHYDPRGSVWHRWDPHIHTPGTLLNNQFTGEDPWDDFLTRIESTTPPIRALGITDYFGIDLYEKVLEANSKGRLPTVELIFPNIELRFSIETAKGSPINAHLLVSPEGSDHITEIRRFLNRLTYDIDDEPYHCNKADLIKLGRKHKPDVVDDRQALEIGANQFKVSFDQLRKLIKESDWAQKNILIAISGNTGDGTSGLKEDASFASLRTELERCSHVIFSANENQRKFWLGQGKASKNVLLEKWGGCKPCLHGSDAHGNDNVGKPDQDRFTWIKGDITFESLRQACIEPEGRAFIGAAPPSASMPSYTIDRIEIQKADWLQNESVPLNSGLVAIVGARGSGKTALADLIAVGGYSMLPQRNDRSFVMRAAEMFCEETVKLDWKNGTSTSNELKHVELEDILDYAKVQYLSQQFVDQLCSAEGLTDELMREIERVIFEAHKPEDSLVRQGEFLLRFRAVCKLAKFLASNPQRSELERSYKTRFRKLDRLLKGVNTEPTTFSPGPRKIPSS